MTRLKQPGGYRNEEIFHFSLFFVFSFNLLAQKNNLSLQFSHILFKDLSDTVEKSIPVKIYYSNNWVENLYLNVDAKNDSLESLFSRTLRKSGFYFIITDDNKLVLSKGYRIKTNFSTEYNEHLKRKALRLDTIQYFSIGS